MTKSGRELRIPVLYHTQKNKKYDLFGELYTESGGICVYEMPISSLVGEVHYSFNYYEGQPFDSIKIKLQVSTITIVDASSE